MSAPVSSKREVNGASAAKPDIVVEIVTLPPIFVVGERSDTSRLTELVDGQHGISFAPGSGLLTDLAGLSRRHWSDLVRYGYPEQYWFRRVAVFFDALQAEYAASRRLVRWAATADAGDLGLVDRLFPRCQVVRVLPERHPTRSSPAATDLGSRRLSARYYQLTTAELRHDPDSALSGTLSFLDDGVEVRPRP
jgi:hypothetical protein